MHISGITLNITDGEYGITQF